MYNFKSLDLLIEKINSMDHDIIQELFPNFKGVKSFYSNPEIYTKSRWMEYRQKNEGHSLDVKYDDFFPYSDCDHCYWTGYFTSRPALKRLERVGSSFLQAVRQVQTLYSDGMSGFKEIELLEKGVAIAQHHDGVSGTSKQHVAYDYAKKIQEGIDAASAFMASSLKSALFGKDAKFYDFQLCQLRNESLCEISQVESQNTLGSFYLIIYNALGQKRSEIVSVPVDRNWTYTVQHYHTDFGEEHGGSWVDLESTVVPNFNYAKIPGSAPFNLLIAMNDLKVVSPTLVKISFGHQKLLKHQAIETNVQRYLRPISFNRRKGDFVVSQGSTEVHFEG
jgi:Alpha mannosidase, middle domain.